MPTNRRHRVRGRRQDMVELTPWMRFELNFGPTDVGTDLETLRDAWEIHADDLIAEREAKYPGTRPWAWWEFEAPEPRREINPPPKGSCLETADRKRPGRVLVGKKGADDLVPWLEEEADYLARLKLD